MVFWAWLDTGSIEWQQKRVYTVFWAGISVSPKVGGWCLLKALKLASKDWPTPGSSKLVRLRPKQFLSYSGSQKRWPGPPSPEALAGISGRQWEGGPHGSLCWDANLAWWRPPTPVVNIPLGNDRIMKSVNIKKNSGILFAFCQEESEKMPWEDTQAGVATDGVTLTKPHSPALSPTSLNNHPVSSQPAQNTYKSSWGNPTSPWLLLVFILIST